MVTAHVQSKCTEFKSYKSGILKTSCKEGSHSVNLVGFSDGSTPYYWLKNSWGSTWGQKGYMQIAITSGDGVCKVNSKSILPRA